MDTQHETNGDPEIRERIPDVVVQQLPTFWVTYLRYFGWRFLYMLAIGTWSILNSDMNWFSSLVLVLIVGQFVLGITFTRATMRPFLRSTNKGRELRVTDGVLTIADADGTESTCPLSECCWAEIESLKKSIGNRVLPDLSCLFIGMRYEKQQYNVDTLQTFMAGTSMLICGLTEESRNAWNQILKANNATYRGAV